MLFMIYITFASVFGTDQYKRTPPRSFETKKTQAIYRLWAF